MDDSPVTPLAEALGEYSALVRGVPDDRWQTPTPCSEWTVRDLVNHMTGGNLFVSSLLDGAERPGPEEMARRRTADFLGADPVASFDASADVLIEAFSRPGALVRVLSMPIGTVPGAAVAGLRLTETVVHGWDLATATEQPIPFSDQAVDAALTFTRSALTALPPGNRAFGPAVGHTDDAAPLQVLVRLLGRDTSWTPRPA
jgi:uncharacterized protein (TIGR03086 family)